jgi:hypothetical protein
MKHSRKINWIIVVICILLIFALFFARNKISWPNTQVAGDTGTVKPAALSSPTPLPSPTELTFLATETLQPFVIPSLTPLPPDYPTLVAETQTAESTMFPTATSTLDPTQCTFPLAQTKIVDSKPEKYTFSGLKVVLANTNAILDLIQWLPDNQQVFIVRGNINNQSMINDQTMELLNLRTGATQVYATRKSTLENPPIWVAGLNAVVYPETTVVSANVSNGMRKPPYVIQRQLWISRGDSTSAQLVEDTQLTLDYVSAFSISANPDGSEIAYLDNTDKQIFRQKVSNGSLKTLPPISFDSTQWQPQIFFQMAWRPGTSQVFLYNRSFSSFSPGYNFLLDTDSGQVCGVDLFGNNVRQGNSVVMARWSHDGRYLAAVRLDGNQSPNSLAVLDTTSGKLYEISAEGLTPSRNRRLTQNQ